LTFFKDFRIDFYHPCLLQAGMPTLKEGGDENGRA